MLLLAVALVGGYLVYQNKIRSNPYPPLNYQWAKLSNHKPQPSPSPSDITNESTTSGETANWKTLALDKFSITVPKFWQFSQRSDGYIFSPGPSASSQLYIIKSERTPEELNVEYQLDYITKTRLLKLGTATGQEYYGCIGVEGCIDEYVILAMNGKQLYEISFTVYDNQDKDLYQTIVSSLKFIP